MSIFYEVLKEDEAIVQAALSDIIAYRERVRTAGPCLGYSAHALADMRLLLCWLLTALTAAGSSLRQVLVGAAVLQRLPCSAGAFCKLHISYTAYSRRGH